MLSLSTRVASRQVARPALFRSFCAAASSTNVFVGNLAWDATKKDLETLFSVHGTISNSHVLHDRETGRSRGFGFVNFETAEAAAAAIEALVCLVFVYLF
jgi:RNA recognition motif-containing protein